jgi:hypothetical protein
MNRALKVAKILVLLLLAAVLVAVLLAALQIREESIEIANRADAALIAANQLLEATRDRMDDLQEPIAEAVTVERKADAVEDATLARVNELQAPVQKLNEVVYDARLSIDNVNSAALDERFYFEQQVPQAMSRVDEAIGGLLPVEANAAKTLQDADVVIANPNIPALLTHADAATVASADTMKHLDGTSADVQTAVHQYLHPSWAARMTGWFATAAHAAVNWFGL